MLYSLEYVKERFEARLGAVDKNTQNSGVWERLKFAIERRPALPEDYEFETEEGYICLLDGRRVGFLSDYVRYRFGISWSLYCSLVHVPPGYPRFSVKYLKAYHNRAFAGGSRPNFVIAVEQSIGESYFRSMIDGAKKTFLKRYLSKVHGMTVDEYLEFCGLPPDYPTMTPQDSDINCFPDFFVYARPFFREGPGRVESAFM
jgi:predicted transcriptional regulator